MADEIHAFTCTIPAGTPKSAPVTVQMPMNLYDIEQVDLEVPSGPAGLMGFYLAIGPQQWIPWQSGQWFVWDNIQKEYPLTNQPTAQGWNLVGYNTGTYNHNVYVRFHLLALQPLVSGPPATITVVSSPLASGASIL